MNETPTTNRTTNATQIDMEILRLPQSKYDWPLKRRGNNNGPLRKNFDLVLEQSGLTKEQILTMQFQHHTVGAVTQKHYREWADCSASR
jgi:hypothetical protein